MRPLSTLVLSAAMMMGATTLRADDISEGEALVKKSDCLACHQATRKVVGPAYVDVAKKYKGKPGAVAQLAKKVKAGGSGVWGAVPMTAHPNLSDADIEKMVKWVLASAASSAPAPTPAAAAPAPVAEEKKEAAPAAEAKPKKKKKRASHVAAAHGHGKAEVLAWSTDEQVRDLMTKQDCFGCHQGTNRNGDPDPTAPWPSFKKIEERYKKNADVAALVKKVKAGEGALRFGAIPHPAYEHLPAEAVEATVRYTLDGKAAQGAPKAADLSAMGAEEWMKTRSDCFSCHQVAQKVVGPSYQDVAKKYTDKDVAMLVKKVKNGGAGNWGNVPMSAHPSAPDDMIEKSVRWVLSQK